MENSSFDSVDLNCPKEVWTLIFEQFLDKSPNQLNNSRLTCPTFKNVIDSMPQRKFQLVLTLVAPYLDKEDILSLRLVSKHSKMGVDMVFENLFSKDDELKKKNTMVRPFTTVDEIRSFYECFKSTHSSSCNPFPGKSILVRNNYTVPPARDINILKNILPIMSCWGSHLKSISLWTQGLKSDPPILSSILQAMKLSPNIQNLKLVIHEVDDMHDNDMDCINAMAISYLPEMKHLKRFGVMFEYPLWPLVLKMVETYSKTLENLAFERDYLTVSIVETRLEFPKLTKLQLKVREVSLTDSIFENWHMPQLTYLRLDLNFDNDHLSEFDNTLKIITSTVGKTLRTLYVYNYVEDLVITKEHLKFPVLKELTLHEMYTEPTAVVNLPSLKTISLNFDGIETHVDNNDVYFRTIWISCPTLEKIQISSATLSYKIVFHRIHSMK